MADNADPTDPLAQGKSSSSELDPVKFLEKNWDQIELFLEKRGRLEELESEIRRYIADVREENSSLKKIRMFTLIAAILYVVFINSLAVCVIFYEQFKFFTWGEYARSAFFILTFGTSGLVLLKVIVGSFKSREDRDKDIELPPGIAMIVDAVKTSGS